jgi:hypothetical protein
MIGHSRGSFHPHTDADTSPSPAPAHDTVPSQSTLESVPIYSDVSAPADKLGSSVASTILPQCTGLMDGIHKPKIYNDGTMWYANLTSSTKPYNVHATLSNPQWKAAMHDEYGALTRNKTWRLVPSQPSQNVIDCK